MRFCFFRRRRAHGFQWTIGPVQEQPLDEGTLVMLTQLTDSQKCLFSVAIVDKHDNPAPIDGKPTWEVLGDALVTLEVSDDGLSCEAVAVGTLGNTQIQVSADADLGEGVQAITGTMDITIVGGAAAKVVISAGTPEEQE